MPAIIFNSFAGGMYAPGANPRLIPTDCCPLIINGTVRNGFIDPRPDIVKMDVSWLDTTAQQVFQRGIYQGSKFYSAERGPMMLYAFDGHIVALDLLNGNVRCLTKSKQAFSNRSPFVWFEQRGPYAVAQDGISPPVIIRGILATQGTKATSVPCGTMMADGWGRFFVVSPDRRKIYASNHEADPNSDSVLNFTEGTAYFKNARYFQIPSTLGKIMGMDFAPSFSGKNDLGPLTVFCEFGVRAFDVSVPREQWTAQDIATTPLPTHGACAHGAIVRRGNDLVFSDQDGHIQTMIAAMRRDENARMQLIDAAVYPLFRHEFAELRRWRQAVRINDRTITTVLPRRVMHDDGRWSVAHDALAVYQETPQLTNQEHVWDGLWTGLGFASLDTVTVNGKTRCLAVSTGSDGMNRLYEITSNETGFDIGSTASPIPVTTALRAVDFETSFRTKKFEKCAIRLGNMQGSVTLSGLWSRDRKVALPWFTDEREVTSGACNPATAPQVLPRINPPAPPKGTDVFFECQPVLTVTGAARLEEVALETGDPMPVPNKLNTRGKCKPQQLVAETTCPPNHFDYDIPT